MTPTSLTATEIAQKVRSGLLSAQAVVEAHISRIVALNPTINAFTAVTADRAVAKARRLDEQRASGQPLGVLAGVPFAVKNLFDVAGLRTLAGSKINRDQPPAVRDNPLVTRLEAEGAVLIGALNMNEYAYGFTGENAHYGPVLNPLDRSRMSGGSSSGSAAAVAADLVPLALGSDTNGSIRVPASFCGIFGLKPTFGRLERYGSFPFVDSLDHLGPLARSVEDLSVAFDSVLTSHPDGRDADQPPFPGGTRSVLEDGVRGLRIATLGGFFAQGGNPVVHTAVQVVARALNTRASVELPEAHRARAAAMVITNVEGAQLHFDRLVERTLDFDPATRDRLIAGNLVPASWYVKAQRFREWFYREVMRVFEDYDILLAPSTPCTAPLFDQQTIQFDGAELPLRPSIGMFTQPISFVGLPVVAAPLLEKGHLPVGIQIISRPWREDLALRVARHLERAGVCYPYRGVR